MEDFIIRPAVPGDLDALAHFFDEVIDGLDAAKNWPGWKKGVYPTREDAENAVQEGTMFVAAHQTGALAGCIVLNHHTAPGYETVPWQANALPQDIFVIHTFMVHPAFARRGLGRKLMAFAEQEARRRGLKALWLDVYAENQPACTLYEQCGYQRLARFDQGLGQYGLDWFYAYEKLL